MKLIKNKIYSFQELEKHIADKGYSIMLRVFDMANEQYAIMAVFPTNFSKDYLSGDGVLFYNDSEVHSSEPHYEYKLIETITIKPKRKTKTKKTA